jgi:mannose-1-phosphate guanylyltransferase
MIGIIPAGGYGSRLFPLTLDKPRAISRQMGIIDDCYNKNALPKPLAPVTNCPILYSPLEKMNMLGLEKVNILVQYQKEKFQTHMPESSMHLAFLPAEASDTQTIISIAREEAARGNAGDIVFMNADIVSNIDPQPAYEAHLRQRPLVTILSTPVRGDETRFSAISTAETAIYEPVHEYQHKTTPDSARAHKRNASIYFFAPEFVTWLQEHYPDGGNLSDEVFPSLASLHKDLLFCYKTDDPWLDVGEPASYARAQRESLHRLLQHPKHGRFFPEDRVYHEGRFCVHGPSLIQDGCSIGSGTVIGPLTSIGSGWNIGSDCRIIGSTVWSDSPGCHERCIENRITLTDCIVGSGRVRNTSTHTILVEGNGMHEVPWQ